MTEYIVIANKLNFRAAPVSGAIIATLPRGQIVQTAPAPAVPAVSGWLEVVTALAAEDDDRTGFVSAQYVEDTAAGPAPKPAPAAAAAGLTVSYDQLRQIAPGGREDILEAVAAGCAAAGKDAGLLDNRLRLCHFIAQAAHESDGFRTTREYWGPTKAQKGYEGRADLGNTRPGDGKRFMGRGIFQLTGRANYKTMSDKLGLDIVANPDLAAVPATSFLIACQFWTGKKLNKFADADDIREVTRRINGGHTGLAERMAYCKRAKAIWK